MPRLSRNTIRHSKTCPRLFYCTIKPLDSSLTCANLPAEKLRDVVHKLGAGGGRKDMSKRRNPQDKARIVMEFFSTNITTAELLGRTQLE